MPRSESRTRTAIWSDEAFLSLSEGAQRIYWLVYSQPTINLCGVLAFTPRRWATFARGSTISRVEKSVAELEREGYFVLDRQSEELFVRSFMRNDNVWTNDKTRGVAIEQARTLCSQRVRAAWAAEAERLDAEREGRIPHAPCDAPCDAPSGTPPDGDRVRARASSTSTSTSTSDVPFGKPSRKRPTTPLPNDLALTAEMRRWPTAQACVRAGLDLDDQLERFKTHHQSKDNRFVDWHAALKTWLANAPDFMRTQVVNRNGAIDRQRARNQALADRQRSSLIDVLPVITKASSG